MLSRYDQTLREEGTESDGSLSIVKTAAPPKDITAVRLLLYAEIVRRKDEEKLFE
jgi:hypothetical protein